MTVTVEPRRFPGQVAVIADQHLLQLGDGDRRLVAGEVAQEMPVQVDRVALAVLFVNVPGVDQQPA